MSIPQVILEVRVLPGAKRTSVERQPEGGWKVRLRARAVEGQANAALVKQFAEWLDVPRSAVRIVRGAASRQKVLAIAGSGAEEIFARLEAVAAGRD